MAGLLSGSSDILTLVPDGGGARVRAVDATLIAGTTYRALIDIKRADEMAIGWAQATGGTGSIVTSSMYVTLESDPDPENAAPEHWQDVSLTYNFTTLPSGAPASEVYPISKPNGTFLLVEFVVGGADVTGFTARVQTK